MTSSLPPIFLIILAVHAAYVSAFQHSKCVMPNRITSTTRLHVLDNAISKDLSFLPSAQFSLEFFKTPGSSSTLYNFGPASPLDEVLYTAERPGNQFVKDGRVTSAQVLDWIDYVRKQGVTNVIALLDENELDIYDEPLVDLMEQQQMKCHVIPISTVGAAGKIMNIISTAEVNGEKVVCHCTGGVGRAGRVAAAWLIHRYNLSPEVATLTVLDQAFKSGVKRMGHSKKLSHWLDYSP